MPTRQNYAQRIPNPFLCADVHPTHTLLAIGAQLGGLPAIQLLTITVLNQNIGKKFVQVWLGAGFHQHQRGGALKREL